MSSEEMFYTMADLAYRQRLTYEATMAVAAAILVTQQDYSPMQARDQVERWMAATEVEDG